MAVAGNAFARRIGKFVVDMAIGASDPGFGMTEAQWEFCAGMVKACLFPAIFIVAIHAFLAEAIFVLVILAMTACAVGWRLAVFCLVTMTACAGGVTVLATQLEISLGVVELRFIKLHNLRCPAFVIGMTGAAWLFLDAAVVTRTGADIGGHGFVAIHAEPGLRRTVEANMTVLACVLKTGVPLDDRAGHDG